MLLKRKGLRRFASADVGSRLCSPVAGVRPPWGVGDAGAPLVSMSAEQEMRQLIDMADDDSATKLTLHAMLLLLRELQEIKTRLGQIDDAIRNQA